MSKEVRTFCGGFKAHRRSEHNFTLNGFHVPSGECEGAEREPYVRMVIAEAERSEAEGLSYNIIKLEPIDKLPILSLTS